MYFEKTEHLASKTISSLFQVTKFSLRHVPNPHTNQVLHEVELWIKDAKGRRRLDLMVKYPIHTIGNSGQRTPSETTIDASQLMEKPANGWVLDGTNNEMEHEARIYAQPVQDMWSYLYETKGIASPDQFLCLPRRYEPILYPRNEGCARSECGLFQGLLDSVT